MPFPTDDYTPYGYLDVPAHTRNLTPRGVLRSHDAGFRWHFPSFAGMYGGRRETYRAGLRLALDGALTLAEFDAASSPYHSKDCFTFALKRGAAICSATYQLIGEHSLHLRVDAEAAARIVVLAEYERMLAATGEWGESGLVGRAEDGTLILQGFEDGEAFVLWAARPWADCGIAPGGMVTRAWLGQAAPGLPAAGFVTVTGQPAQTVALHAALGFMGMNGSLDVLLARGRTVAEAQRNLAAARAIANTELMRKRAADGAFWAAAPRLAGDWPAYWRRGLVYDLETLRMMVKPPVGIYLHRWDAMQIHAPRVVLAEAAIDALLLGYADAATAQELLIGTFLDAPAPNVPCSREDGSFNMVAADGTVCGTAPAWGCPWLVAAWLWQLQPDRQWLAQLYPPMAAYLRWWLAERRSADGGLFYACSWESGQDDSPRFGAQPLGGGHPVRHIRPADLHAAFAHACRVMAEFAHALAYTDDIPYWQALAHEFTARTQALWNGARFADFDTHTGQLTAQDDVMLLAPVALGIATPAQIAVLRPAIAALDPASITWPMGAWMATAAAEVAGLPEVACALAAAICERAYDFWDARAALPGRTLPGISCEYWPPDGRCGGEGYGWGAFTTHLVLHTLLGLAPASDGLHLRPNLPVAWRVPGREYCVALHWRSQPIAITLTAYGAQARVTVNQQSALVPWGDALVYGWDTL